MKVAVLSDVHGVCFALGTVLAEVRKLNVDSIVCNGDMIQGGPQPHETVQLLGELNCPVVMGNADSWLLTGVEADVYSISEERRKILDTVREWSLSQLTQEDLTFINAFHPTVTVDLGHGRSLLAFHGSPTSFDQFLLPSTSDAEFQEIFKPHANYVFTGGHMHLQFTRRLPDSQSFFFNPGSVGMAYNHQQSSEAKLLDPWAECAVLTIEEGRVGLEFRRVPLDMDALSEIYRRSGRPFADTAMGQYTRY
ncbi:MAG: metallophosphoesterase [Anaerolineae bacterium]|nr:MAG: metallophosphoesterase [Anaerolineae bacterium]